VRKSAPFIILSVCLALFAGGLVHLFKLRFDLGDVYPEYSSLRSDPLGTMALYESLERIPGLSVRRDFIAGNQLPEGGHLTYLHLAGRASEWNRMPVELVEEMEGFLAGGGRLAITLFPETSRHSRFLGPEEEGQSQTEKSLRRKNVKLGPAKDGKKNSKSREREGRLPRRISINERWGFEFEFAALEAGEPGAYRPARVVNKSDLDLPTTIEWHSGTVFTNCNNSWRTIYARGTNAVMIERQLGSGTIVMATDSYFLSNEAMRKDRHADLLVWLTGPAKEVVFDEAHFGIVETSGVAMLIRKYRLGGLAVGLLVLAGLFIWKNSMNFVPPYPEQAEEGYVAGKEAATGFVNLLRRNLPPQDLVKICFAEWKKTLRAESNISIARLNEAQAIVEAEAALSPRQRDPVRTYREICRILKTPGTS